MAYAPHRHPVEDLYNLDLATKDQLKIGINDASMIQTGVLIVNVVPFDKILTDYNGNVISDYNGNVLTKA